MWAKTPLEGGGVSGIGVPWSGRDEQGAEVQPPCARDQLSALRFHTDAEVDGLSPRDDTVLVAREAFHGADLCVNSGHALRVAHIERVLQESSTGLDAAEGFFGQSMTVSGFFGQ